MDREVETPKDFRITEEGFAKFRELCIIARKHDCCFELHFAETTDDFWICVEEIGAFSYGPSSSGSLASVCNHAIEAIMEHNGLLQGTT